MSKKELEEGQEIKLKYDSQGLLPAIVQDHTSGEILMLAYVNEEAFEETLNSGFATFWSRSRSELWKKGETSGNMMKIVDILIDCDQDCLIFKVEKTEGGACHTRNSSGSYRNSCFYRKIDISHKKLLFGEQ